MSIQLKSQIPSYDNHKIQFARNLCGCLDDFFNTSFFVFMNGVKDEIVFVSDIFRITITYWVDKRNLKNIGIVYFSHPQSGIPIKTLDECPAILKKFLIQNIDLTNIQFSKISFDLENLFKIMNLDIKHFYGGAFEAQR